MISLAGTTADGLKSASFFYVRWVLILRADGLSTGEVAQYMASYETTVDAVDYSDLMASVSFEGYKLNLKAGVAPVHSWKASIRNEGRLAALLQHSYSLENDAVELYQLLYEAGDTPTASDLIPVARGVLDRHPSDAHTWDLDIVDTSDKDWVEIPTRLITLNEFNNAPLAERGYPIPSTFGVMETGPFDGTGKSRYLGQCRCVSRLVEDKYTGGLWNWSDGQPYQRYGTAENRLAEVVDYTDVVAEPGFFTVDSTKRRTYIRPVSEELGVNDVTDWYNVGDGDSTTSVTISNGDTLSVFLSGVGGKLGSLYADPTIEISGASGSYNYSVDLETDPVTNLVSGADAGDASIALPAATWDEDWDFEICKVSITATAGDVTISQLEALLSFHDQSPLDADRGLDIWRKVQGFYDDTARYADGGLITGAANTVLENPVDQVQAILRRRDCLNKLVAEINTASFTTARALRTAWKFAFTMHEPWTDIRQLDPMLKEAGLHLYQNAAGLWTVVARDKAATPQHAFFETSNIQVKNVDADPDEWESDFRLNRTPNRELVNDFLVRGQFDRSSGEYNVLKIASSAYRLTGTCSVSTASGGRLTADAPGQAFLTEASVGMGVYVDTNQLFTITAVEDDDNLLMTPEGGGSVTSVPTGTTFWLGPDLDGDVLRSRRRYKVSNPMGTQTTARQTGGYRTQFAADGDTTQLIIDHWKDHHGEIHYIATLSTFLPFLDIEAGDVCLLDHSDLPESHRMIELTELDGAITAGATSLKTTDDEVLVLQDQAFYALADDPTNPEVIQVTADPDGATDTATISRGLCGTEATAHADATKIYSFIWTWEVLHVTPATPADPRIRVVLLEQPFNHPHIARFAPEAIAAMDWDDLTETQQRIYRGFTLESGLLIERDVTSTSVFASG